ncbi:MAG TPA: ATP-binding protein [Longimicrobiaceae bacterium]|nr:ATP-binding protein [Longimicrobiaceae bacterium]
MQPDPETPEPARDEESASPEGLARALRLATGAPDAGHALEGVVAEAVAALSASGGAVVRGDRLEVRTAAGCTPGDLHPVLARDGAVAAAYRRATGGADAPVVVEAENAPGRDRVEVLLVPMQLRSVSVGVLLLLFRDGRVPDREEREAARGFADIAALVLEHDQLHEEARSARQARDHFFTALNHEIRTPAMALTLCAELLRMAPESLPARTRRTLDQLQSNLVTIMRVLDGVLALGGPRGTDATVEADMVRPREFVRDLLRRIEPAADRKKLTISYYVPRDLPPLQTRVSDLSRILLHLLSNAVKYTSDGGIEVRLARSVRSVGKDQRQPVLEVRIRDSGVGIAPEQLERIMEPFAQVEEGARSDSRTRGVGLGLSLSRRLARGLGGELYLESMPGRGTTASLILPYGH